MKLTKDLAFICLYLNQSAEHIALISEIRPFIDHNPLSNICIFNCSSSMTSHMNIPLMPISHSKFFDGNIVIFDTMSLMLSNSFPKAHNVFFYTNETPWASGYTEYTLWKKLFEKNNLHIISTSDDVKNIYNICWPSLRVNKINKFSYEEIINVIQSAG